MRHADRHRARVALVTPIAHINENEDSDASAPAAMRHREAFDRERVVYEQQPAPATAAPRTAWLIDLMTAAAGLADGCERQVRDERHRGAQRHASRLGARNHIRSQAPGEPSASLQPSSYHCLPVPEVRAQQSQMT